MSKKESNPEPPKIEYKPPAPNNPPIEQTDRVKFAEDKILRLTSILERFSAAVELALELDDIESIKGILKPLIGKSEVKNARKFVN